MASSDAAETLRRWGLALGTEAPTFHVESGLHGGLRIKGGEGGKHVAVRAQEKLGRVKALAVSRV